MSIRREPALVVPLTPSAVLVLTDQKYTGSAAAPTAPGSRRLSTTLVPKSTPGLVIAAASIRHIYGRTRASLESARNARTVDPHSGGRPFLATDTDLRAYFYDRYCLIAALRAERGTEQEAANRADWSLLMLRPETPVAVEMLHGERTLGGVYVINGDLVVSLRFGQILKRIRGEVGDFISGATGVMSAHDLQHAPKQTTIGELWRIAKSDPSSARLTDIQSGRGLIVDLKALSDSVAAELRATINGDWVESTRQQPS